MRTPLTEAEVRARLAEIPRWEPESNGRLTRSFVFRDHIEAMGFVTRVAMVAESLNHHPDLRIIYDRVEIVLWTHDAGGVTSRDFTLASRIDKLLA
jgi:4a-hydroxytetrahydrobiopterin dehydratase